MHPTITSLQNPKIKHIISLEKSRDRKQHQLFVVEGRKEVGLAMKAGYDWESIFFCPDIITDEELHGIVLDENLLIPVHRSIFEKIAYRGTTGGILAVGKQKEHTLEGIHLSKNPLLLVVESVEKPGNLGALLRTADAANLDAVIICDPQTDFYNPNVIRSSLGCVFTMQIAQASSTDTLDWIKNNNIRIYCTSLETSTPYHEIDFTQPCAIVMGTEATGLSSLWTTQSFSNIIIPMRGQIDSMNVSTAAAVVIFEAKRQRNFQ
jgi:RNA methyltransferase, TrmH family